MHAGFQKKKKYGHRRALPPELYAKIHREVQVCDLQLISNGNEDEARARIRLHSIISDAQGRVTCDV